MRKGVGLAFGIAALAAGLLAQAPAALLGDLVAEASAGRCRLAAETGTLWRGEASLYLRGDRADAWVEAGRLRWQTGFGGLQLRLGEGRLELGLGRQGVRLDATGLRLPAAPFLAGLPGLPRSGWGGRLEIAEAGAQWRWQGGWEAAGNLRWLDAQSALLAGEVLGDYRVAFRRDRGGDADFRVATDRGALLASGQGQWRPGKELRGEIEVRPAERLQSHAGALLASVGEAVGGEGAYRIRWPAR